MRVTDAFHEFAKRVSRVMGSPWAFVIAVGFIVAWGFTGPLFNFSNTWQLVINTSTTIVTFLMVFLLQNTQNRDSESEQLKLDELLRALKGARNSIISVENLSDEELKRLQEEFNTLVETERGKREGHRSRQSAAHHNGHTENSGQNAEQSKS